MSNLFEKINNLQDILIERATKGPVTDEIEQQYKILRSEVISHPVLKDVVPQFLKSCRTTNEFWPKVKEQSGTYAGRREFIWEEFRPLFDRVDNLQPSPADIDISSALQKFDADHVHQLWLRAMERRESDPEGAITLARTLLESICKHILDEYGIKYDPSNDLPGLYKMASQVLNIAPSQHSETIFKQILGGCTAVVEGLGALRNRLSDAHGQGKKPVKPAPRHAELAVNLSGAVATFLVATHQARIQKTST